MTDMIQVHGTVLYSNNNQFTASTILWPTSFAKWVCGASCMKRRSRVGTLEVHLRYT